MSAMTSQITGDSVVLGPDKKNQSSTSLAFVRGTHRWQVDSPDKGPVTQKYFHFEYFRH